MGCLVDVDMLEADYVRYVVGHSCWHEKYFMSFCSIV